MVVATGADLLEWAPRETFSSRQLCAFGSKIGSWLGMRPRLGCYSLLSSTVAVVTIMIHLSTVLCFYTNSGKTSSRGYCLHQRVETKFHWLGCLIFDVRAKLADLTRNCRGRPVHSNLHQQKVGFVWISKYHCPVWRRFANWDPHLRYVWAINSCLFFDSICFRVDTRLKVLWKFPFKVSFEKVL